MASENSEIRAAADERFHAFVEQSPFSVQILSPDGKTLRVNRAWEELWGVTLDQIPDYNLLEDEQLKKVGVMPLIKKAFAGEGAQHLPVIFYDPEESIPGTTRNKEPQKWTRAVIYPVKDADGRVLEVVLMHEDITLQKLAEEKLRESEARYRALFETTLDGIVVTDEQGFIVEVNESFCRKLKAARERLVNARFADFIIPERRGEAEVFFEQLKETGAFRGHFPLRAVDGSIVELEWSSRANFVPGLNVCVARNITERLRAEEEKEQLARQVERERKRLQEIVSSVPGVVWEAWGAPDAENQRIDFVSDYVEKMLGYTVEEWLSTPNFWHSIIHPDDKETAARVATETFKSGAPGVNVFRWVKKDGTAIWVESQSVAVLEENGERVGMRGVTMDITERKLKEVAERFLSEASTTLASSLDYENTLAAVARLAVPRFADWCRIDISDEEGVLSPLAVAHSDPAKIAWAQEISARYPPDPDAPHGVYNVLRTGQSEFYPHISDELLAAGASDEKHLELLREVGFRSVMLVPLKTRGRVLGVITFVNTESSRHHTRDDLSLAESLANRAALAVENAHLFRAEQSTRQASERTSNLLRRLQAVSSSLSQALTLDEVIGAVVEQAVNSLGAHAGNVVLFDEEAGELEIAGAVGFPPEILDKWKRFPLSRKVPIADAVRMKTPVIVECFENFKEEYPVIGPLASVTGSRALTAFPLVVEGKTIGALGLSFREQQRFGEDDRAFMQALAQACAQALERARLYSAEQNLRAQAEAANRIKDEFLATVSHELRTPLNAIVGWSSMLRTRRLDKESSERAIETIDRNARAQTQIIEDLLDVSRIITGKLSLEFAPTRLAPIVRTALDGLQPAASAKNLRLTTSTEADEPIVFGDAARIQQILWNLLSNAIKFTPNGGAVEVKIRLADGQARVSVSDTGQGIKPEFLPYVFDRFRQADGTTTRAYGGLGLGLSIVRHLVEMHGGAVEAESEGAGRGATFTISLPLFDSQTLAPRPAPESDDQQPEKFPFILKGVRVLVVDDERDALELLSIVLEKSGATVETAASAAEAFDAFQNFQPDVLLTDIGMPGEDGYSLVRRVRSTKTERGAAVRAVALTAYARDEDRQKALSEGFQAHVAKPVNPTELVKTIKDVTKLEN